MTNINAIRYKFEPKLFFATFRFPGQGSLLILEGRPIAFLVRHSFRQRRLYNLHPSLWCVDKEVKSTTRLARKKQLNSESVVCRYDSS